jgi:hypothetical protein
VLALLRKLGAEFLLFIGDELLVSLRIDEW